MAERERAAAATKGPGTTPQPGNVPSHLPRAAVLRKENGVLPQPGNRAQNLERSAVPVAHQGHGVAPQPVRVPNNQQRVAAAKKGHGVAPHPVRVPNNQQRVAAAKKGNGVAPQQGNRHNHHESNNRHERKKKRKCLLFTLVVIVSCIAFAGSGVLIAIGYLNPGSIGLGLLGAGAVLYFGTITFLACCCICLTKRYPARQLQSTLRRIRKRPAGNGIPVANPPTRVQGQVRPPNFPNGPIGPVRPNHQRGQQPQNPTPNPLHPGDLSPIAVNSTRNDEWFLSDHLPEPQQTDMNAKTLQSADFNITSDEDPPVDVRIVSHPKKEKTTIDSSCEESETEPSSDPPIDVSILPHPKKEQSSQEKINADVRPQNSNKEMSADSLTGVKIVSNSMNDITQQVKASVSTGFENSITASNTEQSTEYKLVSIPKKDQNPPDKTDTGLTTAMTTTSQSTNAPSESIIVSRPKQEKLQEKKVDAHASSENTTSASDPPVDVRIVPNPHKPRERQDVPATEDFGNIIMSLATDRPDIKEAIPGAHRAEDLASTSSSDPPRDGPVVSQHKQSQQHKKTSHTAPGSEGFRASGSEPTPHVRVSPPQLKEKHNVKNPTAAQSEDPTASLSVDPLTNVSPVPKRRKAQRTREETDTSTCSRDFVWVPPDMLPGNVKAGPNPKQDQQQRAKTPSTSDSEGLAAPQNIAPRTSGEAHRKQERRHLDPEPKDPRFANVLSSSTDAMHQLRLASHLKSHPHSQQHVLKVSSSGGCGSGADVDTSSSEMPNSLPMDNPHSQPPSSEHPKDSVPIPGDPPEGTFQPAHKQEQQSQGSIPPAGQTETSSHGNASSDIKDALSQSNS